jgi:Uma2 family endonuclease
MSTPLKLMTAEEFLPWAEGKEGRWELHDGVPVMMAPERSLHAETKLEAAIGLREAIQRANRSCRVYPDGMAIRVDAGRVSSRTCQ